MKVELLKSQNIELSKLETNKGQIEGLPKNPRHIKSEKYEKLKKSIQDNPEMLGMREVLVYPHGSKFVIIGGNMRFQACKELQFVTVPCKVLDKDTTAEQLRAITIKDNVGFGEHDWELLANEWDSIELEEWGLEVPKFETEETILEAEEDDYEEPENLKVDVVLGDLIEFECTDGRVHKLICGDSTQTDTYERLFDGKLADMVVTDPPYNVNYEGKTKDALKIKNDSMGDSDFYQFLYDFYTALNSYVKLGGAWYVWHADSEGANFRQAMKDAGILVKQCLIWVKNSMVMGRQDYQWKHEPCLYGWKEGAAHNWYSDRKQTTILEFNRPNRNAEHPTMKPIELFAYQITNSSKVGDIVSDGFAGSGTTMVACHPLKRTAYVVELDPKYCQVIIDRMQKLDSSIKVKINSKDYANT